MLQNVELSRSEFDALRDLVVKRTGITLGDNKVELVKIHFGTNIKIGNGEEKINE